MTGRFALALSLIACHGGDSDTDLPSTACNGSDAVCGRRFDQVAFAGTHNAMSNADEGWIAPNQQHPPAQQLADGIRTIVFDTHYDDNGVPSLCHGYCSLGSKPLVDGLTELRVFLDANPREVVVLIFESYVTEADTAAAFAASGLITYAHAQPQGVAWPTMGELIDANERLVVFTDDNTVTLPWLHYSYAYMWENPYHAESPNELYSQCGVDRGDASLPLWTLNHFLTAPLASPELAEQVNHDPFLTDRVMACMEASGDFPNFVLVDFYATGDVLGLVAALNEAGPPGDQP